MARLGLLSTVAALALLSLGGGTAGSGGAQPPPPDGLLVMGVAHVDRKLDAVTHGWVAAVDPATGSSRRRRLSASVLCAGPVLVAGDRVIVGGVHGRRAVARALPLSLHGRSRIVGAADQFVPSGRPGRLWLARWTAREARRTRLAVREVAVGRHAGRAGARRVLPVPGRLVAGLTGGRVVTEDRSLVVWHRGRLERRARGAWLLAARGARLAWCGPRCRKLHVWTPAAERAFAPPRHARLVEGSGALSPDGYRLAVGVRIGGRARIAVMQLDTGAWMLVPGAALSGYRSIAWSPSSRWLYYTAGLRRLGGWRYGSDHAQQLPVDPGGMVMSIATARPPG